MVYNKSLLLVIVLINMLSKHTNNLKIQSKKCDKV